MFGSNKTAENTQILNDILAATQEGDWDKIRGLSKETKLLLGDYTFKKESELPTEEHVELIERVFAELSHLEPDKFYAYLHDVVKHQFGDLHWAGRSRKRDDIREKIRNVRHVSYKTCLHHMDNIFALDTNKALDMLTYIGQYVDVNEYLVENAELIKQYAGSKAFFEFLKQHGKPGSQTYYNDLFDTGTILVAQAHSFLEEVGPDAALYYQMCMREYKNFNDMMVAAGADALVNDCLSDAFGQEPDPNNRAEVIEYCKKLLIQIGNTDKSQHDRHQELSGLLSGCFNSVAEQTDPNFLKTLVLGLNDKAQSNMHTRDAMAVSFLYAIDNIAGQDYNAAANILAVICGYDDYKSHYSWITAIAQRKLQSMSPGAHMYGP